ncbi:hypothetical protein T05_11685 [Trichinella murrelli]|uniref:Uncharacterized protein n=1 Tax=Trichinella murrelli TaxID=144512 RepID=A0A0V0TDB1_9BILA|nr:hypothetical protein T05_11685 [Trichinella murrelli]
MKIRGRSWQVAKEALFDISSSWVLAYDCLTRYILIVCRSIVAIPSGKRETERKGNAPVNTGPSPNSHRRTNNLVEETDKHTRGSGPL